MKAKTICMFLLLCAAAAGLSAAKPKVTGKEKDGWTIFSLSYADASNARMGPFIKIADEEGARTIDYAGLRLSCGTFMSGSLREWVADGAVRLQGKFDVASNPYGITSQEVDLSRASEDKPWGGKLVVDGISVDAKDARGY